MDSIANQQISKIFDSSFNQQYPETSKLLQQISEEFTKPEESGLWNNIGNSCRDALIMFSSELKKLTGVQTQDLKDGDAKGIISKIIKEKISDSDFGDSLIQLLISAWKHTVSLTHRKIKTTKVEAQRIFLWVGLTISEIARIIDMDTTGIDEIQK